ncbi:unnamed protein product [Euphydryas editha]|uniref:Uncharacterized protein n=1 Tax=Euphydryas editha TaxID=104508 RepID=A0AAU9TSR2_EUPED|nr:unnamed protein product [Euphydryas editha]
MFQKVFSEDFNIGFKSPASDACSTCILLSNKIKIATDPDNKRILMVQKRVHNLRAKAFYKLCRNDDPDSENFCFDLQQVQPWPRTPIQESFYSRQISYYNLCFVGMDSRNPRFYQWSEDQGGRGATEVGSALLHLAWDVLLLGNDWGLKDVKSLETYYKKLEGMRDLKRVHLKKYNVIQGRGTRRQTKSLYEAHPRSMAPLTVNKSLSAQKKADVKSLMVKQFGDNWEEDETLPWYKKILSANATEPVDTDADVPDNHEPHDHDAYCDCLEPEIATIV